MDRREQLKEFLMNTNALLEAMRYSASTATGEHANLGRYASYHTFMRKHNDLARRAATLLPDATLLDAFDLAKIRDMNDTTWPEQKAYFEAVYANASLLKSLLEGAIGYAEDESHSLKDFIHANLRRAVYTEPEKELEVQNAVESLMIGRGMERGTDYDRETGRVKTSGKESVPDFILPRLKLCLEVKLSKTPEKLRSIVDEINADIRAYQTVYERQLYVVYDVGTIRDEAEFKRGLEDAPGVQVVIVKH